MKKVIFFSLFVPSILFSQWVQTHGLEGKVTFCLNTNGTHLYAGTALEGLFISTNNGINWVQTSLNNRTVFTLELKGNYIFAGSDTGLFISSNQGLSWSQPVIVNHAVFSVLANDSILLAGTTANGIYLSTNNGLNWLQTSLNDKGVHSILQSGNYIYAGTYNLSGVFISTNGGFNWVQSSLDNQNVNCLAVIGLDVFAGVNLFGVYHSANYGTNWTQAGLYYNYVRSFAVYGSRLFAGTDSSIYLTSDNGINWVDKGQGLPSGDLIPSLAITNNYLFAATSYYGVWRIPLSEIIGVEPISSGIPNNSSLFQNYPNPFNPITNIKFQIAKSGDVKLVVFDVLGREVTTLVNEQLNPGTYEVQWDASSYPSGVYFYRLITNTYSETKKMVLMK